MWGDVCRFYANTVPFYKRRLEHPPLTLGSNLMDFTVSYVKLLFAVGQLKPCFKCI
jgi:hypothetical protein